MRIGKTESYNQGPDVENHCGNSIYSRINMLLDRAWSKPKEYDPKSEEVVEEDDFDPRNYTPEQLKLIEEALRLVAYPPKPKVEVVAPGEGEGDAP
jgi:hypothetical protein